MADHSPFLISFSILDRYGFYLEHTRLYSLIMNPTGFKMHKWTNSNVMVYRVVWVVLNMYV